MKIREATQADEDIIVAMTTDFLRLTNYGELLETSPAHLFKLLALVLTCGVVFLAFTDDGEPIGMLGLVGVPNPISSEPHAEELVWWVHPEHRGNSRVGPKLLRCAEDWTRQKGLSVLKMVAPAGSTVGAFYERSGYRPVETAYIKRF